MRLNLFVAIATRDGEEFLCGAGTNRRLVEIQRDSYLMKNIDWASEIQEIQFDVTPKTIERIVLPDEQKMELGVNELLLTREEAEKVGLHYFEKSTTEGGDDSAGVSKETDISEEGK